MSANTTIELSPVAASSPQGNARPNRAPDVAVCVDAEHDSGAVISHAKALAGAFGAGVVLVSVIEPPGAGVLAVDPVGWDIRRRELLAHLTSLAERHRSESCEIGVKVLEGRPAEQICDCLARRAHDIIVLSRASGAGRWATSKVAGGAMASTVGVVVVVPDEAAAMTGAYRTILVPLDGSPLAESALPKAARLAKAHGAKLVLCHATPEPVLTEVGPADPETVRLKAQIAQHNKRVATDYLNRVRDGLKDSLKDCGVPISTHLINGGDVRRALVDAVAETGADIVVMASHGRGAHADVSSGDVAGYILDRSTVPILIVRQPRAHKDVHIFRDVRPEGVRRPATQQR